MSRVGLRELGREKLEMVGELLKREGKKNRAMAGEVKLRESWLYTHV